jgi:hypothetical protein
MNSLFPQRIEGIRSPRDADERTLRMCFCEQDAVVASIRLSGLTLEEIGSRIGVSKQAVRKWKEFGVPDRRTSAFQNATGTYLLTQYRAMERALREAVGKGRERDRISSAIAPTQAAWDRVAA